MRTYDQFCALARALDVVGDRWTLLIVRELLIRDGARYTDLQYGLPGIATNLLANRLRELEEHGIVTREAAPPPVATTLFRLTPRGRALKPVLVALGEWGGPLLETASGEFRSHWLVFPLERRLQDHHPDAGPVTIELQTGDQPLLIEADHGRVSVRPGTVATPDATLRGTPPLILDVLGGDLDLTAACAEGLEFDGDPDAVRRVAGRAVAESPTAGASPVQT